MCEGCRLNAYMIPTQLLYAQMNPIHGQDEEPVIFPKHPLAWSWDKVKWLLSAVMLFLIVIWPTRPWEIAEDKSTSEIVYDLNNQLREQISFFLPTCVINCFHKLTSWVKAIYKRVYDTLPLGLVDGALAFVAYYVLVEMSERVFRVWETASLASVDTSLSSLFIPSLHCFCFCCAKMTFSSYTVERFA